MKQKNCYKVGDHIFSITLPKSLLEELHLSAYEPFLIAPTNDTLFDLEVVDTLSNLNCEPVLVDAPLSSQGMPQVNVYRVECGFRYEVIMPYCDEINASLEVNNTEHKVQVALQGKPLTKLLALNNAVILSYISFTLEHATLLLHASTVIYEGNAYLFLGKSGTGKSTHSRMWLEAFDQAELLNDDHPIVRRFPDGTITAYGSPWSGKTPCYRNLSAPMKAIVRISRATENSLEELRPLRAFASITTSCSGVQWSTELMNHKVAAIEQIVKNSKGYVMHCLPNSDAARVCFEGINKSEK